MKADSKKTRMSVKQQYDVDQLLTKHLKKTSEGYVEYDNGLDDHTLAEKVGVRSHQVQFRRREIFGDIRSGGNPDNFVSGVKKRVEDLEARVQALEDAATSPKKALPMFNTPQPWKSS